MLKTKLNPIVAVTALDFAVVGPSSCGRAAGRTGVPTRSAQPDAFAALKPRDRSLVGRTARPRLAYTHAN
jgi:hypothetical protein